MSRVPGVARASVDAVSEPACPDPTRLSGRRWLVMAGGWSLLLTPWVVVAATRDGPWPLRAGLVLAVLGYAACYIGGLLVAMERRSPAFSAVLLVTMTALWTAMAVGLGDAAGGGVLYTVSFLIVAHLALLPRVAGVAAAVAVALGAAVLAELRFGGVGLGEVVGLVAITVAMIGMFGVIRANAALQAAREELARLAVVRERERMARDLHDVLGHSLTSITVKAGAGPAAAGDRGRGPGRSEVVDVERLGRQALAEVRATVAGSRVTSLAGELVEAREALRAAGIVADLPTAVDDVPAERQEVFAFVLREGVTNVVRHSGARHCAVRLDADSLEVATTARAPRSATSAGERGPSDDEVPGADCAGSPSGPRRSAPGSTPAPVPAAATACGSTAPRRPTGSRTPRRPGRR